MEQAASWLEAGTNREEGVAWGACLAEEKAAGGWKVQKKAAARASEAYVLLTIRPN